MRLIVSVLAVVVATSGCNDTTSPERQQRVIYGIKVSPIAAVTDSIRISFNDGAGPCDTGVKVETEFIDGGIRFVASSIPTKLVCPLDAIQLPLIYVVPPPHFTPFSVKFAEPGQGDSVRIVETQ